MKEVRYHDSMPEYASELIRKCVEEGTQMKVKKNVRVRVTNVANITKYKVGVKTKGITIGCRATRYKLTNG